MITVRIATNNDIDDLMSSRIEMLKDIHKLPDDLVLDSVFIENSRNYFHSPQQTTVLAYDDQLVIGCATICYIKIIPSISRPNGKKAHIMNVYTHKSYRRQGIASKMLALLIEDAKAKGVTEVSLDATSMGEPLYKQFGFVSNPSNMILKLPTT